jgi:hypothetical protein
MTIRVFFILLFSIIPAAYAQKEAAIWYFGYGAGLDFNCGSPVSNKWKFKYQRRMFSLMIKRKFTFYTDGSTVYNKKSHQQ